MKSQKAAGPSGIVAEKLITFSEAGSNLITILVKSMECQDVVSTTKTLCLIS